MPQDCSKWTDNEIHSNNVNYFEDANEAYCNSTPFEKRRKKVVCPVFQVVVGTGFMFYGVNDNIIARNYIYDQHRNGIRQFAVPAAGARRERPGEGLRHLARQPLHGQLPRRAARRHVDPNGLDVYWDEQGLRNCWEGNHDRARPRADVRPASLPTCASGGSINPVGNTAKLAAGPAVHHLERPDQPGPAGLRPGSPRPPTRATAAPPRSPQPPVQQRRRAGRRAGRVRARRHGLGRPAGAHPPARASRTTASSPAACATPRGRRCASTARGAVLRDDAGRVVTGGVTYAHGFTHGLYGPSVSPKEPMPDFLALRLGTTAVVGPGETVPFTVSWRGTAPVERRPRLGDGRAPGHALAPATTPPPRSIPPPYRCSFVTGASCSVTRATRTMGACGSTSPPSSPRRSASPAARP